MQTLRGILIKTCSKTIQRIYTSGSLQGCYLINSMHPPPTTRLIALPCLHLLNCKRLLQAVWIPQWYFVTCATRSIAIEIFKMLRQGFKIFKSEVLKAASFRRWNAAVFEKFVKPIFYLKSCLKICLYWLISNFVPFKFCCRYYRNVIVHFQYTFIV